MSNQTSDNNKRIAKNTLLLYVRMLFTMAVSLFTSRVILNTLGVEDYGINNVVGGIVTMFSVLSGSLSSSISRFITFELGKGNIERLKTIFSTGINIQLGMSVLIIIIAEAVGIWFLNTKMNIPTDRMVAANWVFQCAILTFVLNLLSVPYNAAIIAHEKMSAFAYISVVEVSLKLIIVYMLMISPFDRLETYAVLLLLVGAVIRFIYGYYCKRHFEECTYHFVFDKPVLKEMTGFAGWNFLGNGAYMLNTQGVNILMNLYFGVAVNAARGIATQVDAALKQFVNNFTTAVNPQITKSYAQGDLDYMHKLVCRSAKFSAFLMMFFAVPIILETNTILTIWLKTVPDYAVIFLQWIIISSFMDTVLANSLVTSMFATGKIKRYQIIVTTVGCLVFPLSWIAFKLGFEPQVGYILYFIIYTILLFVRLYLLKDMVKLPVMMYIREVLYKLAPIIVVGFAIPGILILTMDAGWLRLILVCLLSVLVTSASEYFIGLSNKEKNFVAEKIKLVIGKIKSKWE
jgi:O-antigen/teichoic acid export membrane protein